jgi:lipoprotein NlpI
MIRSCMLLAICAMAAWPASAAESVDELLLSARRALQQGDKDQALKLTTQAIEAAPSDVDCLLARGVVYDARREFDKAVLDYGKAIELDPKLVAALERRGEDQFRLGKFAESIADFDRVLALQPGRAPYHWQRGISLYYAGRFEDGARQFELHKSVNPEDVENAVWHYLCVARTAGIEAARKGLIPIRSDARVPMMQVHALFAGTATPEDVLRAAKAGQPREAELQQRLFYAHLYIGLYLEAAGQMDQAREHLALAVKYADNDYMGDTARVHATVLKHAAEPTK